LSRFRNKRWRLAESKSALDGRKVHLSKRVIEMIDFQQEREIFCENCRADTECIVEKRQITGTIRGVKYLYFGKEAKCKTCGELVYVPEINDENLKALYAVFKKENGLKILKSELQEKTNDAGL